MSTKIFISWSGQTSGELGEALREWIPAVLQFAKPYFTPKDIDKGAKWNSEIARHLEESQVGIICLTKNNLSSPWMLFEAGALSKNLAESRVCVLLQGLDNTDVAGPLSSFQSTQLHREDFLKLIRTINDVEEQNRLDSETLLRVFEKWWPDLEERVKSIQPEHGKGDGPEIRKDRELLEEVLDLTRLIARSREDLGARISPQAVADLDVAYAILTRLVGEIAPEARNALMPVAADRSKLDDIAKAAKLVARVRDHIAGAVTGNYSQHSIVTNEAGYANALAKFSQPPTAFG